MALQYKEYGKTGDKVSALGFGLMRLPMVGDHSEAV
jgi:predicted aldo/keto reductase-like oxidoreductase